jgi:hypothetical protein
VNALSDMLAQGATPQEIVEGYPSLSTEQVRLARVYASAHPRRGRPTSRLWTQAQGGVKVTKSLRPLRTTVA